MARRRAAVPLLVAAALVLGTTGCGEGDDGDDDAADLAPAQTAVQEPEGGTSPPGPEAGAMTLASVAFADGATIPAPQVCVAQGGGNQSPPLTWEGVPEEATSLALVMDDPDAPVEGGFVHWVVVDLDPAAGGLEAGEVAGVVGRNGAGAAAYLGPCPPPGDPHTYVLTLYAFAEAPAWPAQPTRADVEAASGSALATAELRGTFGNGG